MDVTPLNLQINLIDCDKAFEFFGQAACFKNGINWQMILQQVKGMGLAKALLTCNLQENGLCLVLSECSQPPLAHIFGITLG